MHSFLMLDLKTAHFMSTLYKQHGQRYTLPPDRHTLLEDTMSFVSGKHSSSELDLNSADATEEQSLFTILNTLCSSFIAAEINTIKIHTGLPVLVLPGFVDVDVWSV